MIHYRPFRNTDPPWLVRIWRGHASLAPGAPLVAEAPSRGLAQPISVPLFDQLVLSKPYFDRRGLIVAVDDGRPVGFVHAGFGPNAEGADLATDAGATCMLMALPHAERATIERELLSRSEEYLRGRGATALFAGETGRICPFYLGLYGGSEMPGVLDSDRRWQEFYRGAGYEPVGRTLVFQREMATLRPIVDRTQMQIRRRAAVEVTFDPSPIDWWQACTLGSFDRIRFDLRGRDAIATGGSWSASATFWLMEPLSATWGVRTAGLSSVDVADGARRQGLATFLLCESLRQLHEQGIALVEAHASADNAAAIAALCKLGFKQVDQGISLRKG